MEKSYFPFGGELILNFVELLLVVGVMIAVTGLKRGRRITLTL